MKNNNQRREAIKKIGTGITLLVSLPVVGSLVNSCEKNEGVIDVKSGIAEFTISDYPKLSEIGKSVLLTVNSTLFVLALQVSEGVFKTYSATCPHQGCYVGTSDAIDQPLVCPCHNSKFSAQDGSVVGKPNDGTDIGPLTEFSNTFDEGAGTLKVFIS